MSDISSINTQGLASEMLMKQKLANAKTQINGAGGDTGEISQMHKKAREAAESFEAMFLSQMLQPMFSSIPQSSDFGGGHAETMFRGMLVDEMGQGMARSGGIGLADNIYKEILKMQEAA